MIEIIFCCKTFLYSFALKGTFALKQQIKLAKEMVVKRLVYTFLVHILKLFFISTFFVVEIKKFSKFFPLIVEKHMHH